MVIQHHSKRDLFSNVKSKLLYFGHYSEYYSIHLAGELNIFSNSCLSSYLGKVSPGLSLPLMMIMQGRSWRSSKHFGLHLSADLLLFFVGPEMVKCPSCKRTTYKFLTHFLPCSCKVKKLTFQLATRENCDHHTLAFLSGPTQSPKGPWPLGNWLMKFICTLGKSTCPRIEDRHFFARCTSEDWKCLHFTNLLGLSTLVAASRNNPQFPAHLNHCHEWWQI